MRDRVKEPVTITIQIGKQLPLCVNMYPTETANTISFKEVCKDETLLNMVLSEYLAVFKERVFEAYKPQTAR